MSSKKIDPQKKYWWVIYAAVPIVVALVAAIPSLITALKPDKPSRLPEGISITNNNFGSNMYFITQVTDTGDPAEAQAAQQAIQSATNLVQNNDYANAIAQLEQVAAQYPLPSIYNNLGVLYANLGEYEKARDAYQKALKLDPNDQAANFNLGLLEQFQGNTIAAQSYLGKAPDLQNAPISALPTTADVMAESTSQIQGVTARLLDVTRFQNTITARILLVNSLGTKSSGFYPTHDTYLMNEENQSRYTIVAESNFSVEVPANGSIEVWAKYQIPAEDKPQYLSVLLSEGIHFDHIPLR